MERVLCSRLVSSAAACVLALASGANAAIVPCDATSGGICTTLSGSTCTISAAETVTPGDTVDCSGKDIAIQGSGSITVTDGRMTILARNVTITNSRTIKAIQTTSSGPEVGFEIFLAKASGSGGNFDVIGSLEARNPNSGLAGYIRVEAEGYINLQNSPSGGNAIDVKGTAADADGGEVRLLATGNITVSDPILADGSGSGSTAGGQISIISDGGDVLIEAPLSATGQKIQGGEVEVVAAGDLTVSAVSGISNTIDAEGKHQDGDGGQIALRAGGLLTVNGNLTVNGGIGAAGGEAAGGVVELDTGCDGVSVAANIAATGGAEGGGAITITTPGAVTIAGSKTLNAGAAGHGGNGGTVAIASRGAVTVSSSAVLDASGHDGSGNQGAGSEISIEGCTLNVQTGAVLDSTGYSGGWINLRAGAEPPATGTQPLTVHESSTVTADGGSGGDGEITLAAKVKTGCCSTSGSGQCVVCTADSDCPSGCGGTGHCYYANPDTGGVVTQFVPSTAYTVADEVTVDCLAYADCTAE